MLYSKEILRELILFSNGNHAFRSVYLVWKAFGPVVLMYWELFPNRFILYVTLPKMLMVLCDFYTVLFHFLSTNTLLKRLSNEPKLIYRLFYFWGSKFKPEFEKASKFNSPTCPLRSHTYTKSLNSAWNVVLSGPCSAF